jgi:TIR domain-containing protein
MSPAKPGAAKVFISYRRDDSGGHVGRLYDALCDRLGRERLFFDIDHIAPGQDFVEVLEKSLSRSSVLLVVIGKRWAGTGKVGSRRIDNPADFVRLEVAAGLRRRELWIIPVLIQGAKMPGPATLPDELKDLSRRNAFELSDLRWKDDIAHLIAALEVDSATAAQQVSQSTDHLGLPQRLARVNLSAVRTLPPWAKWAGIAATVLLLLGLATGAFSRTRVGNGSTEAVSATVNGSKEVPRGDQPQVPAGLSRAVRGVLPAAKKWRKDAVLTGIQAQLSDSGAQADEYQVNYDFRSPLDGAGLTVMTGRSGDATYKKLPAAGSASSRALPDSFVDLPLAIATARQAGMFGQVKFARLSVNTSGTRAGRATWVLRPFESSQSQAYYVDASTGKLVPGPQAKRHGGLIGKIEGIIH